MTDQLFTGSYPSDALTEAKQLRAAITHALERLDASLFTNAEHQQAKDTLRAALRQPPVMRSHPGDGQG